LIENYFGNISEINKTISEIYIENGRIKLIYSRIKKLDS